MPLQDVSADPLPQLPPRSAESHKGDFGRVLIVGGSRGMSGAPALAGMAALRSGAGLVTVAIPTSIQPTVAGFEPAYMTLGCGASTNAALTPEAGDHLIETAAGMSAVAIGPGMGTDSSTVELVQRLLIELFAPTVVDADGLNALATDVSLLKQSTGRRILTPHPGEFSRLVGKKVSEDEHTRVHQAAELCNQGKAGETIVVLKGHRTIVTDGQRYSINTTGNPGMATGGTGDCLTGIIVALIAQGLDPFAASRLGAHVHGRAGDLAAATLGQVSMTARDLIDYLPEAFQQL